VGWFSVPVLVILVSVEGVHFDTIGILSKGEISL